MKNWNTHSKQIFSVRKCFILSLFLALSQFGMPVGTSNAQSLEIKVTSITSPVSPGQDATIKIQTAPNANCQITVQYKSGPSKAKGLIPKMTDNKGQTDWTWKVGTRTTPGNWPINITCVKDSQRQSVQTSFDVR